MGLHLRVVLVSGPCYARQKYVDHTADESCVTTFSAQRIFIVKCTVKIFVLYYLYGSITQLCSNVTCSIAA